jgi:hypothetical protein
MFGSWNNGRAAVLGRAVFGSAAPGDNEPSLGALIMVDADPQRFLSVALAGGTEEA